MNTKIIKAYNEIVELKEKFGEGETTNNFIKQILELLYKDGVIDGLSYKADK